MARDWCCSLSASGGGRVDGLDEFAFRQLQYIVWAQRGAGVDGGGTEGFAEEGGARASEVMLTVGLEKCLRVVYGQAHQSSAGFLCCPGNVRRHEAVFRS